MKQRNIPENHPTKISPQMQQDFLEETATWKHEIKTEIIQATQHLNGPQDRIMETSTWLKAK
jgi:hypothetical protein